MATNAPMNKRELIDKSNSKIVLAIAIATFLAVFSLIASQALWSQRGYQARVIEDKEKAVKQLNANKEAVKKLETSYRAFVETQDNAIGGDAQALGDRDGDNAKIVLDALPSKYDYPALVTSIEKLLSNNNFALDAISGEDQEITEVKSESKEPVRMPFTITTEVNGYPQVDAFLRVLYASIRPINYNNLIISGSSESSLELNVEGFSYYQPSKGLTITEKVVK